MASGPIIESRGEKVETVTDFALFGSKITVDGDCSYEIKWHLLRGRKAMTNLDSVLKSRDITLLTIVCIVKAMVFPVAMYGCKSWTRTKPECWRINAFKLQCWRILLRVIWTARRWNELILKEISPEYLLEELTLKLKLQYFGNLRQRADSLEQTLMLGKIEVEKRRGQQRMRCLYGSIYSMDLHLSKLWKIVKDRKAWCDAVNGISKSQTWLSDWTIMSDHELIL